MNVINTLPAPFSGSLINNQNDIIPALHLSRWAVPGLKIVDIIGDSTSTDVIAPYYTLDPTQTIWGALKSEIVRRNPHNRFVFNNRGINGAGWTWPTRSANAIGIPTPPSWYVDLNKVWLDYVRDDQPDTLFFVMGTNAPDHGQLSGDSVAVQINDVCTMINGWVKVPDIILCTTKIGNPAAGPPYSDWQENFKAMAAFLRTFARSSGKGYIAFPRIKYFGLIDLGRQYAARALGKDYAFQYLSSVPSALHNGYTLVGPYTSAVTTIGTSTDGDLRVTFVFHAAGGTAMYAALGFNGFYVNCTGFWGNRIHVTLGSGGNWIVNYELNATTAPAIAGTTYSPPAGDVTMTITLKGEVCRVLINNTYVLDTSVPRLIQNCTVSIGTGVAPTGAITFDVTEFLEGIAAPALQTLDPTNAFGAPNSAIAGNDINHPSSPTVALIDYTTIAAANLSAPQPTAKQLAEDDMPQIYADFSSTANTAVTTEEVLKTAPILAGQLFNIGDVLTFEAWGSMAGTTDSKTVAVRFGGITGTTIGAPNTVSATGTRWRLTGNVAKRGTNAQTAGSVGIIGPASIAFSVATTVVDSAATSLVLTSQNNTTAAAASITCDGFRVTYIKAPGT